MTASTADTTGYRISRVRIRNFGVIAARDLDVPPAGVVIEGPNGTGKTTVIDAIAATLQAVGVSAKLITRGEEKGEATVDLDGVSVTRKIPREARSTVKVQINGAAQPAPQDWLTKILGKIPLSPLRLFLPQAGESEPEMKRRWRKLILDALPIKVTVAQLQEIVPSVPATYDVSGHGLEVLARLGKLCEDHRGVANSERDAARVEAGRLEREAARLKAEAPASAPSITEAEQALGNARVAHAALVQQDAQARAGEARTAGTRKRVADLRGEASARRKAILVVPPGKLGEATARAGALESQAQNLERQAREARAAADDARKMLDALEREDREAVTARGFAAALDLQADDLEAGIAAASVPPVPLEALAQAREAVTIAEGALTLACRFAASKTARSAADLGAAKVAKTEAKATALDGYVRRIRDEAPRKLFPADAVPGLGLDADGEIALRGVPLERISQAERMAFAVEISKRAVVASGSQARFLLVDELEHLDAKQFPVFVRMCVAGNWQLVGARVAAEPGIVELDWIMEEKK